MLVKYDKNQVRFSLEMQAKIDELEPTVLHFLDLCPGASVNDFKDRVLGELTGAQAIVLNWTLKSLINTGKIRRKGKGKRGSPYKYFLAAQKLLFARARAR